MEKIVLIDGMRTPFMRAGTTYMDTMSYELGQFAIKGLLTKTGIDPAIVCLLYTSPSPRDDR